MTNIDEQVLIARERKNFHARLLETILSIDENGVASNADKGNGASIAIAGHIAKFLVSETHEKLAGQTSGSQFEEIVASFVKATFHHLGSLRPGEFTISKIGNKSVKGIAGFEQYKHLIALKEAAMTNPDLAVALGRDYTITPDIVISRELVTDEEINSDEKLVDDSVSLRADLRKSNGGEALLHASISAKWTMRSDRAQNSRSEALNLIRNRKGNLPHIMVVTGEPLPSRLSSLALGTGDIDCVYHFALYELMEAVKSLGNEDSIELMNIMVEGKRLKDISDLPLDLAI
ncbi:restriction endonuclease [Candidatus Saccharibacteria bacterium]|nr:restriction endonuclease [Candidatus Saccharibacteria bacterium]